MSGIGGSEFILLCLIGLLILGPERLPRVARQIGGWMGKARQMTRSLQRQLEEEVDVKKNFGIDPKDLDPNELLKPLDDDTFSPLHDDEDEEKDEEEVGEEAEDPVAAEADEKPVK
jgi:sec-independent protein translocase protein TatB